MNFHHPNCDMLPIACAGCVIDGLENDAIEREIRWKNTVDVYQAQLRERRNDYIKSLKGMAESMEVLVQEIESLKKDLEIANGTIAIANGISANLASKLEEMKNG